MIARAVTLAGGLTAAATASQFPEFSQQYVQRLGGAVDALEQVVADFDSSAATAGLSREDALNQLTGTAFLDRRRVDMQRSFERHSNLSEDLKQMQSAGPFMRAYHAAGLDTEVARAAWGAFKPAIPLTFAGLTFAAAGLVAGLLGISALIALLRIVIAGLFRGRTA